MSPEETERIVAALFSASYTFFVRLAMRRAPSRERAEETVQEAMIALYEELRRGGEVRDPKAWVTVVLYRMLAKEHHRQRRETQALEAMGMLQDPWEAPADGPDDGELERWLNELTPREREVVLLRADSRKYREIASLLGISKNSVNTLLARALRKLHCAAKGEPPAKPAQRAARTVRTTLQ